SVFYDWLNDMYVSGMAMAIRRQTDSDSRSVSILRFLKLLKGNPSLVSRKRYGTLFPNSNPFVKQLKDLGLSKDDVFNKDYDKLVGKKKPQPTPDDVQAEIDKLLRVTSKIARVANKVIAHHEAVEPRNLPT